METPKVKAGIVITARCHSERFPFKVIKLLAGKPMIVQIIEKCKIMNEDYDMPIILGTTYEKEDDELCKIARGEGIEVFRGPDRNLLLRHKMLMIEYRLQWMVGISGDSPFFDIPVSQRMIDGMYTFPDCDAVNSGPVHFPIVAEMNIASAHSYTFLLKCEELLDKHPDRHELQEAYWTTLPPDQDSVLDQRSVKTSDLISPSKTPIKSSVDYPIELFIANKVCEVVGHVPLTQKELIDAYKLMTEL